MGTGITNVLRAMGPRTSGILESTDLVPDPFYSEVQRNIRKFQQQTTARKIGQAPQIKLSIFDNLPARQIRFETLRW